MPCYSLEQFELQLVPVASLPLVTKFYKACRYPAKAGRGERVYCLRLDGQIVAALKLVPKTFAAESWLFLRAMCVLPQMQGRGIGKIMLQLLQPYFDQAVYCYPFAHLENFYGTIGFTRLNPEEATAEMSLAYQRLLDQGRDVLIMSCEPAS
ncbi:GNAT family N-acetyltransferase [uncultured Pseudoteredinibacter sp.]|uniref:GNAT family N-acetyltransferase n=1 Tax=uncultured Pseudoteredinibacter sp. TaxID=1641701 RepID=UPI00262D9CA3|nr:GNAT family N-acetyltransferase [uncultured Pseudoteredinibacter sp.]